MVYINAAPSLCSLIRGRVHQFLRIMDGIVRANSSASAFRVSWSDPKSSILALVKMGGVGVEIEVHALTFEGTMRIDCMLQVCFTVSIHSYWCMHGRAGMFWPSCIYSTRHNGALLSPRLIVTSPPYNMFNLPYLFRLIAVQVEFPYITVVRVTLLDTPKIDFGVRTLKAVDVMV